MLFPMKPQVAEERNATGSPYRVGCPACGAPPLYWCSSRTGRKTFAPHSVRIDARDVAEGIDRNASMEKYPQYKKEVVA